MGDNLSTIAIERLINQLMLKYDRNMQKYNEGMTEIIERYMDRNGIEYGSQNIDFYNLDKIAYDEIILLLRQ